MGFSDPLPPANVTLTEQTELTQPYRSPIAIGAIAAFWIIVGVAAGVFEYGATRSAAPDG